ncbi:hypothetical protein P3626_23660 [Vibrio parahaemolyticus]|nr:hypothetical protein [Vibrio parahaemolyticus]
MKYDDASWHYGGDFPENSPIEFGATHIALIMKWCFQKGWAGVVHTEDESSNKDLQKVISGECLATEYFMYWCDGKLTDEDFTEEGNSFLHSYYGEKMGLYTSDYVEYFGELMYMKGEDEHDYQKFSEVIEKRYQTFISKSKPWWKLW